MTKHQELRSLLQQRTIRFIAISAMLIWIARIAMRYGDGVRDVDTWWHLSVGNWIVENRAVPHSGLFSLTAAGRPWVAYSWGYEVILSRAYNWYGLVGIGMYGIFLSLAISYVVFWSLQRLSGRFWTAWLLAACTLYAFLFMLMPRPVFVSIVAYVILLTTLLVADRCGQVQQLFWLPALFLVWANIHIQFIYGLFVFGLFVAAQIRPKLPRALGFMSSDLRSTSLPAKPLLLLFLASVGATFVGPYGYHLYAVILAYSQAHYSYRMIGELQPLSFRLGNHFVQLLLTATSFVALGWQKKVDPFKVALLLIATVVGFRTLRDSWFIAITASALIADSLPPGGDTEQTWKEIGAMAAITALFIALCSDHYGFNERELDRSVSDKFPVNAANFLRVNPLPGPLYNNLDWGGFLIWYMPQYPVAIDGRNDLYGDALDRTFHRAQDAVEYKDDPYLNNAGCVLLEKRYALSTVLKFDPRFVVVYEDPIAVILTRR